MYKEIENERSKIMAKGSARGGYTHCSDHWSAPLFMYLLPAENSCMRMRNKIKTNPTSHLQLGISA